MGLDRSGGQMGARGRARCELGARVGQEWDQMGVGADGGGSC